MVIDDFLDNADAVRAAALRQDYPVLDKETAFPGRNSAQRIQIQGLDDQVGRMLGLRLRIKEGSSHAKFRLTLAGDTGLGDVHIDNAHLSGVYYLTLPEHCEGGTDFFKHKRTGLDQALLEPREMSRLGVNTHDEANAAYSKIMEEDARDRDKWEQVMRVPMRYNRLILFRPWLWHTAGPGFGTSIENGRLVYLLFYEEV